MFIFYLFLNDEFLEVNEEYFYKFVDLYSEEFSIWKFDSLGYSSCESSILPNVTLYYYLNDCENNRLLSFGKVIKVNNCASCLHCECDQYGTHCALLTKETSCFQNRKNDCRFYSIDLSNIKKS